ncbi:alpha-ketoglutarate-dependent dioxygenase AlkB [Lasioglossum baleicum]|uniref:alpha-ketoglutarate-dependent dioxygenase AlkB n=1 Tax=Lasioglossum baleicum TaxID=434251 RepID=UPI003FCD7E12
MFRDSFKYYKSRNPPPDLKDVIDLNDRNNNKVILKGKFFNEQSGHELGLRPVNDWQVYEFFNIPGLVFIKNPFTPDGQRYWIIKCLKDYSRRPNKLNLDAHDVLGDNDAWWDVCLASNRSRDLLPRLRWATLGYHHNWDTKLYSETSKTEMPSELSSLTSFLAKTLNFMDFKAEAAIINYYRMNSTLAGHTDHSEVNVGAPLFSISFGQTAIFLIGGLREEDAAHSILLRSGDIVIMSGESRLRYHGVPKILPEISTPWDQEEINDNREQCCKWLPSDWKYAKAYISEARINMNVRQVLTPGQSTLP